MDNTPDDKKKKEPKKPQLPTKDELEFEEKLKEALKEYRKRHPRYQP